MHNIISSLSLSLHPTTLLKTYTTFYPVQISTAATMVVDVMPWLVNMRRLDRYNIMNTYDRWAEEIQALLAISGLSKAIGEKGGEGDDTARAIIMLSLERDLRDFMAGKINANNAVDLWNGIKKAKKVLVSVTLFNVHTLRFAGRGGGLNERATSVKLD
jgi:hypothetical protein